MKRNERPKLQRGPFTREGSPYSGVGEEGVGVLCGNGGSACVHESQRHRLTCDRSTRGLPSSSNSVRPFPRGTRPLWSVFRTPDWGLESSVVVEYDVLWCARV